MTVAKVVLGARSYGALRGLDIDEVVNAREGYNDLDSRLDAISIGGSNVATLANGAASAGQAVLTVDDTTGFVVGAAVVYQTLVGDLEYNTIASVDSGTQLTLTANIGGSGVPDDGVVSQVTLSEKDMAGGYNTPADRLAGIDSNEGVGRLASAASAAGSTATLRGVPDTTLVGRYIILSPGYLTCEIRRISSVSGNDVNFPVALANTHPADRPIIVTADPTIYVSYFGNGNTHTEIQAALDEAKAGYGASVVLDAPTYNISATITMTEHAGTIIRGRGSTAQVLNNAVTRLIWGGNSTSPAFLMVDCRKCVFRDFMFLASTIAPLESCFESQNGSGATITPSLNAWIHVTVEGTNGGVDRCWRFTEGAGGDFNNDQCLFFECVAFNYGEAGVSFEHSQSKAHRFFGCTFNANDLGDYGVTTALNTAGGNFNGGSFLWYGGFMAHNLVCDFYLGNPNDAILISGLNSEESGAFLISTGPTGVPVPVTIQGVRWANRLGMSASKTFIHFQGPGPLLVEGCIFNSYETDTNGYFKVTTFADYGKAIFRGNEIFSSSLTIFDVDDNIDFVAEGNLNSHNDDFKKIPDVWRSPDVFREVWIPPQELVAYVGSPAFTNVTAAGSSNIHVIAFDDSTYEAVSWSGWLPPDWLDGFVVSLYAIWSTPAAGNGTTDAVFWVTRSTSLEVGVDAYDKAHEEIGFAAPLSPSTAKIVQETKIVDIDVASDERFIRFSLGRDGTNGGDTHTGDAYLLGVRLVYRANLFG